MTKARLSGIAVHNPRAPHPSQNETWETRLSVPPAPEAGFVARAAPRTLAKEG